MKSHSASRSLNALPPGTILRDCVIESELGGGGFSIVYLARHHLDSDWLYAIKEFLPGDLAVRARGGTTVHPVNTEAEEAFDDGLRRFRDEAEQLRKFSNEPCIVSCLNCFEQNGTAYLVMDHDDGLPLSEFLRQREESGQPFAETDLLAVVEPLLEGLTAVHRAGVLHRDIKPENIFVRRQDGITGRPAHPVLIGFGAAKQNYLARHSRSRAPRTPGYAAYEQVSSMGEIGPWTDVYALGALMWRMVAGGCPDGSRLRVPDKSRNSETETLSWSPTPRSVEKRFHAVNRGCADPMPPAVKLGAGRFSKRLLKAIDKCLALYPKDRVQNCEELRRLLKTPFRSQDTERKEAPKPDADALKKNQGRLSPFRAGLPAADASAAPESNDPGHDETIVAVETGFKKTGSAVRRQPRKRGISMPLRLVALAALILAAVVVFVMLPRWVDEQQPEETVVGAPPPPEPPEEQGPVYTAEEIEGLREQADALLARLLNQQSQLDRRSAAEWGGGDFETYQELGRSGDDAYLADAFRDSVDAYEQALDIGEELLTRSIELIDAALDAAREALEAGNADVAAEQFSLALQIEPDNGVAQAGLLRAQQLPDVLALVRQGEELERSGDLEGAVRAYREAVALDGLWAPARSALNALEAAIRDRRFDDLMSRGLNAMAAEEFGDAHELFAQALALRPDSGEARSARTQADQSLKLEQIALVEARALAFELRERWDDALRLYNDALQTDSTLAFAQEGRTRAQYRVDLELKLRNLVDHPDLLFDGDVLRDARLLAAEAGGISPMGPRLGDQVESLERLLTLASTPLPVQLQSDELTEVTLFRVGRLGQFLVRDLELRPGAYTAVGSRSGYRDVRVTFTVLPGQSLDPIRVECVEPI